MSAPARNLFDSRPYNGAAFPGDIPPGGEVLVAVAQAPARPRAGGGRIFIIIGLVLALVGFGLAVLLGSLGGVRGGGASCPCDLVVYAAKDIGLRTQIATLDQVKVKSIPDAYKPAGAIVIDTTNANKAQDAQNAAGLKAVQNFIAEVNIAADQPLLTSMLAKPGDTVTGAQAAFLPIPAGYVAITLPTSELIGVAGYPQAGDYISILATSGGGSTASARRLTRARDDFGLNSRACSPCSFFVPGFSVLARASTPGSWPSRVRSSSALTPASGVTSR